MTTDNTKLKPNDPEVIYVDHKCEKCGYYVNRLYGGVYVVQGFVCYFCRLRIAPIYRPKNWGVENK